MLLVFAAVTSAVSGEWIDAAIIVTIFGASVGIGFSRELRAQSEVLKLISRARPRTRALRDGVAVPLLVSELVPGDVVVLSAGNVVPADSVILASTDLYVNEAVLSGESFPVDKRPGVVPSTTPLAGRNNCAFLGSNVRGGTGEALVVATGRATRLGDIAHRLSLRPPESSFERGVRRFGHLLTIAMLVMVLVVLAVNTLLGRPPIETLLFSLALAVGLSPELLPVILSLNLAHGAKMMARHGVLVKRLSAIQDLGSMAILCTDKTGTLTEGVVRLEGAYDPSGQVSPALLLTGGDQCHPAGGARQCGRGHGPLRRGRPEPEGAHHFGPEEDRARRRLPRRRGPRCTGDALRRHEPVGRDRRRRGPRGC